MIITNVTLKTGKQLDFGSFIVFIGGNAVGKSTFMLELYSRAGGIKRGNLYWVEDVNYSTVNIGRDMELLKSSMSRHYDGPNYFFYSSAVKNIDGNVDQSNNLRFSKDEVGSLNQQTKLDVFTDAKYRRPFVAYSSCDARQGLQNQVTIQARNVSPTEPINVLYRNRKIFSQIDETIFGRFNIHFVLLDHLGTELQLGVSHEESPTFDVKVQDQQSEYERIQTWKDSNFTPISEAGHGIRSMIRLLTSLLEPVNQVIIIDEPELHLYPAQKRWLGKQLVDLASNQGKQVFLVTHDPIVLQGILDANTKTNIYRVNRQPGDAGQILECALETAEIGAMKNQEQFLQGLFYQRCIVVEGASDRSFYQNLFETSQEMSDKDVGFVACGGKGGTKHMAHFVERIGVNAVFIYDLDVILFNTSVVIDVFKMLGGEGNPLENLYKQFSEHQDYKSAATEKDRNLAIKNITNFDRKTGISGEWVNTNKAIIEKVINDLEGVGIFLVPNGTLESWAPDVEPKVRFAELAPPLICGDKTLKNNFDQFAKRILRFLDT